MKKVFVIIGIVILAAGFGLFIAAWGVNGFQSCGTGPMRYGGYQVAPPCAQSSGLLTSLAFVFFVLGMMMITIPLSLTGRLAKRRKSPPVSVDDQPLQATASVPGWAAGVSRLATQHQSGQLTDAQYETLNQRLISGSRAGSPDSPAAPQGAVPILLIGGALFGVAAAPEAVATRSEVLQLRGASEPADAVVVGAREATLPPGVFVLPPAYGVLDVTLEVTKSDGSSYSTVMRVPCGTPKSRDVVSTAGARLSVRMDPANPRVLGFDIASLS